MKKGYLITLIILTMLTLSSLALNGAVIFALLRARQIGLNTVTDTRAILNDVGAATFSYTLEVNQEIPIRTSIPFDEEVLVPVNTSIPINTTVVVPIDAGLLGEFNIPVPIQTVIPIELEIVVPISQTVEIAATVPLNVEVPIEIPIADTPLIGYLENLDAALERIAMQIERPFDNED